MSAAKLCKDCTHVRDLDMRHPVCAHPQAPHELVKGRPAMACYRSRLPGEYCGEAGNLFELAQPMLDRPECSASATRSSELDNMQAAKSAVQACNIEATNAGLACENPCPNCASTDLTTARKYVSAVSDACRIKVSSSAAIYFLPCGGAILSAAAGRGKSWKAWDMAHGLGCHTIVEEWSPSEPITPGALHLTNVELQIGGAA